MSCRPGSRQTKATQHPTQKKDVDTTHEASREKQLQSYPLAPAGELQHSFSKAFCDNRSGPADLARLNVTLAAQDT